MAKIALIFDVFYYLFCIKGILVGLLEIQFQHFYPLKSDLIFFLCYIFRNVPMVKISKNSDLFYYLFCNKRIFRVICKTICMGGWAITRPYKQISRGGWVFQPPLQMIIKISLQIHLVQKNYKNTLKICEILRIRIE